MSKTAQEKDSVKISYADILKAPAPDKLIKNAQVKSINVHEIKEFINSQQQQEVSVNEIKTKKQVHKQQRKTFKS